MIIGKVIGNVWATRKADNLNGLKFMIVELQTGASIVACDGIGAGIGDKVLIIKGSSARKVMSLEEAPIDAAIIGIIDEGEGE